MFHFYGHVLLTNSIFVNDEIVAAQVGKEISIWVFHVEFDRYLARYRLELDFRLLRPLLPFEEWVRRAGGDRDLGALLCLRRCVNGHHTGGKRLLKVRGTRTTYKESDNNEQT